MAERITLALVIPVFNFARGIEQTLQRLDHWEKRLGDVSVNIVFSDDGSEDGTASIIDAFIAASRPQWRLLRATKNQGKGQALRAGIQIAYECGPDIIVFSDCDLHYGLDIITERLVPRLGKADIVIADRSLSDQGNTATRARQLASAVFNRMMAILTGVTYKDTQAGLKGFYAEACRPLFDVLTLKGFAFDVELLSVALRYRMRIDQLPVKFEDRHTGPPSSVVLIPSSLRMLLDLLRINRNWKAGRYDNPELRQRIEQTVYTIRDAGM